MQKERFNSVAASSDVSWALSSPSKHLHESTHFIGARPWRRCIAPPRVFIRAQSAFEARAVAAEEFEQDAASAGDVLKSPWMREDDTIIEPFADKHFSLDGEAQVLRPTRETVTGPEGEG